MGALFCADAKTGKALWTGGGRQGEYASLVDAGDVILALTAKSKLFVFEASDKAYAEKACYSVSESATWAHPVVSGNSIYIKDAKSLTRWSIP